ncbi:hypothetical protein HYY71_07345 [Candidatus Woesearchaeota archaeon]|nr:hypothetical protein [Candidatus Woesearchaeota archaeon]
MTIDFFAKPQGYVNHPMGPLKKHERKFLEREIGELCPKLEFMRYYHPAGLGYWQNETEDFLKFQCPAQNGDIPDECMKYKSYCTYMLANNELLKGFDSVY